MINKLLQMKSKITLKQIAKELGVSVSTVSKALNDSPEIGDATKARVVEFAQLNNFKPNALAKSLKNQKSFTIGVILPNILNPFFAKVFKGIEEKATKMGYNVVTAISNESRQKEALMLDILNNGIIDGFILALAEETQEKEDFFHLNEVMKSGTPVVLFDRVSESIKCDKVIVDDYESAIDATNHLLKTTNKKIALISTIDNLSVGKLRFSGYKKALEDANVALDENLIIIDNDLDTFDEKLEQLIKSKKIDAIFAVDEYAATSCHKKAIKNGIKIPEELSIIGFADGVFSRRLTPSLSTVSQHAPEIGEKTVELLIAKINEKDETERYKYKTEIIKTELRHRESTKK